MAKQEVPKSIRASLYIDGKPAQHSIKNVEQVARQLRKELNGLTVGTAEWNEKMKAVQANQIHLQNLKKEVNGVGGAFGFLRTELGKFGTLAAGYLGFQFITNQFQNIIAGNARLSDSLADIRRVAGLTEAEVRRLDKSFGDLDTRTSKAGLREIAVVAGKLGVAKNDILGFVEATDMLVVALGDELGNADQVTTQLGKILNVFDGEVNGDNITRLGNAMVKLANDGVATAGFISDFTQRVSGIAKTAGMALGPTLGLAAGLEELGARPESAATAIQKLLVTMAQDIPASAKIAKVGMNEFNEMFAKTPELALLAYAEGLTQNKNAFSDIAIAFKDAGEEGVRVVETITKLGERADFMRTKFDDGTVSLQGYNEILDAFALKNETLGAKTEKLGKTLNKLTQNQTLTEFLIKVVDGAIKATDWIERNANAIGNFAKVITTAIVAWTAYNLAVKISTVTLMSARTATISMALAKAILTGNTIKATQAMRLLNIAIKANPLGLLVATIMAAATAFVLFNGKVSDSVKIQRTLTNVQADAEKASLAERLEIARAVKALANDKTARDKKLEAVNALRVIMPNVLKNYSDEEIMAGKAAKAITDQTKAILEQAKARAIADKIKSLYERQIDIKFEKESGNWGSSNADAIWNEIVGGLKGQKAGQPYQDKLDKENQSIQAQIDALLEESGNKQSELSLPFALRSTPISPFSNVSTKDNEILVKDNPEAVDLNPNKVETEKEKNARLKNLEKEKQAAEKLQQDLAKINEEIFLNSLEESDKEIETIRLKYEKLRVLAKGNKTQLDEINRLEGEEAAALQEKITAKTEEETRKQYLAKQDAIAQIATSLMSENELELEQTRKKYTDLLQMADKFEQDKAAIIQAWADENAKIQERQSIAAAEIKQRESSKWKLTDKEYEQEKKDFMVQMASEAANATFDIIRNSNQAKLDAAVSSIERERDAELSNKNLTEEQKKRINEKYDAKLREAKQKAWKADQAAAIAQAIVNGAVAVTKVLAQTGILSPFAIPAIAAGTAFQVAAIASQKMPEFADGGFSDKDPAGYVSQATIFNRSASGRPFVAGEEGKEWIAPNWMVNSPKYANIIGMLETARQEKRYFAGGGSTEVSPSAGSNSSNYDFSRLERMMSENTAELKRIKEMKVEFVYKDYLKFKKEMEYSMKSQGKS